MEDTRRILEDYRVWAVVGLSQRPDRDSHGVANFLRQRGYRIVPVNPTIDSWEGETCYPRLREIPFNVDVVDIFRRPPAVPAIVDEAIRIGARVVWMQLGVTHAEGEAKARSNGLRVVVDRCPKIETRRHWPADDGPRF